MRTLWRLVVIVVVVTTTMALKCTGENNSPTFQEISGGENNRLFARYRDLMGSARHRGRDVSVKEETLSADTLRRNAYKMSEHSNDSEAINLYKKSLEVDSNSWRAWHGYGHSLFKVRKYTEAEKAYRSALKLHSNKHSWLHLGITLQMMK